MKFNEYVWTDEIKQINTQARNLFKKDDNLELDLNC